MIVILGAGADTAIDKLRIPVNHSALPALNETVSLRLGDWRGASLPLSPEVLDALKLTDYFLAEYRVRRKPRTGGALSCLLRIPDGGGRHAFAGKLPSCRRMGNRPQLGSQPPRGRRPSGTVGQSAGNPARHGGAACLLLVQRARPHPDHALGRQMESSERSADDGTERRISRPRDDALYVRAEIRNPTIG